MCLSEGLPKQAQDDMVHIHGQPGIPFPAKDKSVLGRKPQSMQLMKALGEQFHNLN